MKIETSYWAKPIPTNKFDWSAIDSDTYDADYRGEEDGWVGGPIGYGPTEEDAVADLMEQLEAA